MVLRNPLERIRRAEQRAIPAVETEKVAAEKGFRPAIVKREGTPVAEIGQRNEAQPQIV